MAFIPRSRQDILSLGNPALTNGLVSYWGMDYESVDYGNKTVADLMPTGTTLTMSSNTSTVLVPCDGQVGGAMNFPGQAYLDVSGSTPWVIGKQPFTICLWYYPTSTAAEQCLYDTCGLGGAGIRGNAFILLKYSNLTTINIFSGGSYGLQSNQSVVANRWNYIAFVRNHTGASGCDYWINDSYDSNHPTLGTNLTVQKVIIGRYGDSAGGWLTGKIDDVRTYLRALDPSEIRQIYQAQMPVLSMPAPVPSLYQRHFRFRTDAGAVDGTPTWGAEEDAA